MLETSILIEYDYILYNEHKADDTIFQKLRKHALLQRWLSSDQMDCF